MGTDSKGPMSAFTQSLSDVGTTSSSSPFGTSPKTKHKLPDQPRESVAKSRSRKALVVKRYRIKISGKKPRNVPDPQVVHKPIEAFPDHFVVSKATSALIKKGLKIKTEGAAEDPFDQERVRDEFKKGEATLSLEEELQEYAGQVLVRIINTLGLEAQELGDEKVNIGTNRRLSDMFGQEILSSIPVDYNDTTALFQNLYDDLARYLNGKGKIEGTWGTAYIVSDKIYLKINKERQTPPFNAPGVLAERIDIPELP